MVAKVGKSAPPPSVPPDWQGQFPSPKGSDLTIPTSPTTPAERISITKTGLFLLFFGITVHIINDIENISNVMDHEASKNF
ncbi:hypothetical protein ACMAUO_07505 [Gluconacetobacter sp. Hr-1-5]|uniref:hypothetical protein n=1 Tax=Gluconacetobacter sp. Hr-1-5 TaxID=3395370 RepID=UPI003B529F0D